MAPQSYFIGGKIRAADFNIFAGDINDVVGTGTGDSGYGQGHLVVTQAVAGQSITAALWDELLTSIKFAAQHQGTSISVPTSTGDASWPTAGNVITILPTLETDISNIVANKLNSDISYMAVNSNMISSTETYVAPGSGTPNWTGVDQVYYEAKIAFGSADARRHFFNTGGEIRLDATLTGVGTDAQSLDWQSMLSAIGTVKLGHSSTESANSVGTPGNGFNNLTTSSQVVYTKGGTGDYSGNQLNIYAKLSGTADIEIKASFDDAHIADSGSGWTGTDYVAGTLTVTLDEFIASDSPDGVELSSPTYTHISEL